MNLEDIRDHPIAILAGLIAVSITIYNFMRK